MELGCNLLYMNLNDLEAQKGFKLIEQFTTNTITAQTFETQYMALWREWRDHNVVFEPVAGKVFSDLFTACDVYCGDPALRNESSLDEAGLKAEAAHALYLLLTV